MLKQQRQQPIVYNADGVAFTIYKTTQTHEVGAEGLLASEDYSTGKRRLLNNASREAAEHRADQIREAMVKGQAHRMLFSSRHGLPRSGICVRQGEAQPVFVAPRCGQCQPG